MRTVQKLLRRADVWVCQCWIERSCICSSSAWLFFGALQLAHSLPLTWHLAICFPCFKVLVQGCKSDLDRPASPLCCPVWPFQTWQNFGKPQCSSVLNWPLPTLWARFSWWLAVIYCLPSHSSRAKTGSSGLKKVVVTWSGGPLPQELTHLVLVGLILRLLTAAICLVTMHSTFVFFSQSSLSLDTAPRPPPHFSPAILIVGAAMSPKTLHRAVRVVLLWDGSGVSLPFLIDFCLKGVSWRGRKKRWGSLQFIHLYLLRRSLRMFDMLLFLLFLWPD